MSHDDCDERERPDVVHQTHTAHPIVAEGCPHLRTQHQEHTAEDQCYAKQGQERMIDFLPRIVFAKLRIVASAAEKVGGGSLQIAPIAGLEPHCSPFAAQRSNHNMQQQGCDETSSEEFMYQ